MFSKLLYIINVSSYKKEQLKLHRSFLGVKGAGGGQKTALSPTFSCNGKKLKLWGGGQNNPMRSSISSQCYFYAKCNKNASTIECFLKFLGEQNNP